MAVREELIQKMFERGILLHQELLQQDFPSSLLEKIEAEADLLVLNSDYTDVVQQHTSLIDWYEIDRYRVEAEKQRDDDLYQAQLQQCRITTLTTTSLTTTSLTNTSLTNISPTAASPPIQPTQELSSLELELETSGLESSGLASTFSTTSNFESEPSLNLAPLPFPPIEALLPDTSFSSGHVEITISYKHEARKYEVKDFTSLFLSRYRFLGGLLRGRQELSSVLPISRILVKKERETVALIGMISEISTTKNGNLLLTVEDLTGQMKVLVTKNKNELHLAGKELTVDEVVGITGTYNDNLLFVDSIVWPDLPAQELKRDDQREDYAIFLSDIHVGSALFLKEEFEKFLQWINGRMGNDAQREIAAKIRYIFIAGDLVDGIGVYPAQEKELTLTNISQQYAEFARLIREIPRDKEIIIGPGNHDVVHLAEPQPALYKEYAQDLLTRPNVHLVTNPALITIGKTATFPGFDVLLYHGYSFDYYVANIESIRAKGGYHRADLIMKFLLKRRHVAPSFKSTPYFPGSVEDPLLIKKIPDFFVTGHIHYSHVANYKGVTMISCSCWQGKTTFQEKLGHEPEPGRVPLVNLRTREVKILRFC